MKRLRRQLEAAVEELMKQLNGSKKASSSSRHSKRLRRRLEAAVEELMKQLNGSKRNVATEGQQQ